MGADAQWNDDVHHALRVALTGERRGYYLDYDGVGDLAHAFAHRWVFDGRWSEFRARTHGRSVDDVAHQRFVAFSANHDHVGNTPTGARPPFDHARRLVAAATVLLSPYTPMLFMGDEYAEPAPFPFFVDHGEGNLLQAVRQGRRKEYARSEWPEEVADPASPATFERAVLDPSQAARSPHREILAAHVELLACRRVHPTLTEPGADHDVERIADAVVIRRHLDGASTVLVVSLGSQDVTIPVGPSTTIAFDTADRRWWPADGKAPTAARVGDGAAIVAGLTVALFIS
nr:DUF3459 domain-containing protein [Acidimicrobiia bacterium]